MKISILLKNIKNVFRLCLKENRKYLVFSLFQIISISINPFITSIFMKYFIDGLSVGMGFSYILKLVLIMIGLRIVFETMAIVSNGFTKLHAKGMMVPMAALFCKQAVEMDYENTCDPKILEEVNRASTVLLNGDNLEQYLDAVNGIIIAIIQIASTIFIITSLSPIILLVTFLVSVVVTGVQIILQQKNYNWYRKGVPVNRRWHYILNLAIDIIYGKTVRVYQLKEFIMSRSKKNRQEAFQILKKTIHNNIAGSSICLALDIVQTFFILMWLIFSVIGNVITIGSFVLLLNFAQQFSKSLLTLSNRLIDLYKNDNYINDFFVFINRKNRLQQHSDSQVPIPKEPSVLEFKNVSFKYPYSDRYVLKDVNLCIQPGEHIMIVGENGSGKTTLVKLLLRLYDVEEGEILYNGVNIKDYSYNEYLKMFATVFTDYQIFALSVYENIVFQVKYDHLKTRVDHILEKIGLNEKINSLPSQGETVLSHLFEDDGISLSGGEMQKLAFARSLYREGNIQILDEPTASLSPLAESELYEQFNRLLKDKTSIFISHRLSSNKICDKICVLENGLIAEYGTHKELLEQGGIYSTMFRVQSQYY